MGAVTQAMAAAARAHGAAIRTSAPVRRIRVDAGIVLGVELASGEFIAARTVLANAHPRTTLLELVEPGDLDASVRERVAAQRADGCVLKMHLAVNAVPRLRGYDPAAWVSPFPSFVEFCPSVAYLETAYQYARAGRFSVSPWFHLYCYSVADSTLAPPGAHTVSAFVQYAPYRLAEGTWDDQRDAAGERVIDERVIDLMDSIAPGFRASVIGKVVLTPLDMERLVGLVYGNIHHTDMVPDQMFERRNPTGRPGHATPIAGLYLCSSSTHPGGEVTGAPATTPHVRSWRQPLPRQECEAGSNGPHSVARSARPADTPARPSPSNHHCHGRLCETPHVARRARPSPP